MQTFDWGQFTASTVSVLLILAAVWWWVKRNRGLLQAHGQQRRIQVVEALPLSLKHKMVLIQVDNQMVLASVSPGEVKTLHAWREGGDAGSTGAHHVE
ncbi:MAG: Flagellar biosynthesis protein FliO [Pseudomonadota bacterium]|jgi:flagellar biogenesis protein FliO